MTTYVTKLANDLGLRSVSARKPLTFTVTKKDTARGIVKDPECCALALACRRVDPEVKAAYFFKSTAWLQYEDKLVRYALPNVLQKEIVSFDRSGIMAAGEYHLAPSTYRKRSQERRQFDSKGKYKPRSKRRIVKRSMTMVRKLQKQR